MKSRQSNQVTNVKIMQLQVVAMTSDRQTDGQTQTQTDRQTDRQTDIE